MNITLPLNPITNHRFIFLVFATLFLDSRLGTEPGPANCRRILGLRS